MLQVVSGDHGARVKPTDPDRMMGMGMTNGAKPSTLSITGERPAWAPVSDAPVVGLRQVGASLWFAVPEGRTFTLGTADHHDVRLADQTVSSTHCLFDYKGRELWVEDTSSKNGTYVNGVKTTRARLIDGSILVVGQSTFVAFAEASRSRRGRDEQLDGRDPRFRIAVDAAIEAAMRGDTLVLVGEAGSGRHALARAVHEVAIGPHLPFVRLRLGADAAKHTATLDTIVGTLFVEELSTLPTTLYRRIVGLMSGSVDLAPGGQRGRLQIVVSAHAPLWQAHVPERSTQIDMPPLRDRGEDLVVLLDRFASEFLGPGHAPPSRETVAALRRYSWPGNVGELKEAMRRLAAIVKHRSQRAAGDALGLTKSAVGDWLKRRGLPTSW